MMLRALALCLLTALPVAAQDFRGLLPGMPVSDLGRLGEPLSLRDEDGHRFRRYPLPFERSLLVVSDGMSIGTIGLEAFNPSMTPPPSTGLRVGESDYAMVTEILGSSGFTFAGLPFQQTFDGNPAAWWQVHYELVEHPQLVLSLLFRRNPASLAHTEGDAFSETVAPDATLVGAYLTHEDALDRLAGSLHPTRNARPCGTDDRAACPIQISVPIADVLPMTQSPL